MPRLPIPGSDEGTWGDILNEYLSVELASDGSLKRGTELTQKLNRSGDTMGGELSLGGNKIVGLANPTTPQDAVTKAYVDGLPGVGSSLAALDDTDTDTASDQDVLTYDSGTSTWVAAIAPVLSINSKTGAVTLDASDVANHTTTHQSGGTDELNVDGLSGELADPQVPKGHSLGGIEHSATTLAALNAKISDATLDDASATRTPTEHGNEAHSATFITAAEAPVQSVNGDTGIVSLDASDVGADPAGTATTAITNHEAVADAHPATNIEFDPTGLEHTTAVNVQQAITEHDQAIGSSASVVQVVTATLGSDSDTTADTPQDSGLEATIMPAYADSIILARVSGQVTYSVVSGSSINRNGVVQIRDTTGDEVVTNERRGHRLLASSSETATFYSPIALEGEHEPGSTATRTYRLEHGPWPTGSPNVESSIIAGALMTLTEVRS